MKLNNKPVPKAIETFFAEVLRESLSTFFLLPPIDNAEHSQIKANKLETSLNSKTFSGVSSAKHNKNLKLAAF